MGFLYKLGYFNSGFQGINIGKWLVLFYHLLKLNYLSGRKIKNIERNIINQLINTTNFLQVELPLYNHILLFNPINTHKAYIN